MKMRSLSVAFAFLFLAASWSVVLAAPHEGSFLSNGVKLRYVTAGEGEPVILVHGFAASAFANWIMPGVFDALSQHYRVIALDNRGHGGSGKPHEPEKYGVEMAEDVVRLLDHLKIQKAHIVGYSLGAFITDKIVTTHPERCLTATLGGAGWAQKNDDRTLLNALAKSLDEGKGILPLMRHLQPPDKAPLSEKDLEARNRIVMFTNDAKALSACIRGAEALVVPREKLESNQVPILAIVGDKDPLKKGVDAMDGVMHNLKIVVVPGGDHMSTFRSSQFRDALLEFLAAHSHQPAVQAAAGK
jgi:pimeloyl-ACP methyl ester carboxylesterase